MIYYIYIYIYSEQGYKSFLSLNEKCIFENVLLLVVKMKSGNLKVINMNFPHKMYINYKKLKYFKILKLFTNFIT